VLCCVVLCCVLCDACRELDPRAEITQTHQDKLFRFIGGTCTHYADMTWPCYAACCVCVVVVVVVVVVGVVVVVVVVVVGVVVVVVVVVFISGTSPPLSAGPRELNPASTHDWPGGRSYLTVVPAPPQPLLSSPGAETRVLFSRCRFVRTKTDHFAKTGSGQTLKRETG
jgi:hypothetical protein